MDKIVVPYTNGVDQEVKGYVDLTKIVEDAVKEAEQEIQELKDKGKWKY